MRKSYKYGRYIAVVCIAIAISGCSSGEIEGVNKLNEEELVTAIRGICPEYRTSAEADCTAENNQIIQDYEQAEQELTEEFQNIKNDVMWMNWPPEEYCGGECTEFTYLGGNYWLYKKEGGNYAALRLLDSAKGNVVIPEKIPYENEEYTLKAIYEIKQDGGINRTSEDCVQSIEIPETVVWLNENLFSGFGFLQTVHLPSGLKHISPGLFSGCYRLERIDLPQDLISIGAGAFRSTSKGLGNPVLDIPDTVVSIGEYAFAGAHISRIHIPENIEVIGDEAFADSDIEEIVLPYVTNKDGVLPARLLKGSQIRTAEVLEGWEEIPDEMFAECSMLRLVKLPETVKKIGNSAFADDSALLYVNMPSDLEEVGFSAFSGCEALLGITLPEKVKVIKGYTFAWCKNAIIKANGNIENVEDGAFIYCKEVRLRQKEVIAYCQNKFPEITFVLEEEIKDAEVQLPVGLENMHGEGFSLNDLNICSDNREGYTFGFDQVDSTSLMDNQGNRYWQGYRISSPGGAFFTYEINGKYKSFTGVGAVDAEAAEETGAVGFKVYGDDVLLYSSKYFRKDDAPEPFSIDISGVQILKIEYVDDRDTGDYGIGFIPKTNLCTIFDGYLYE